MNKQYDPFKGNSYKNKTDTMRKSLKGVLYECGYLALSSTNVTENGVIKYPEKIGGIYIDTCTLDPIAYGKKIQRGYEWKLEHKLKLLKSIYNDIFIGTFIVREYSYNRDIAFRGVLDGKQKLSTIVGFMNNEFPDQNGKYFKDFSKESKDKFLKFMNQNFVLMSQETTDDDACQIMIDVNDTG
ncbi:DUF262 domain-containing protein, partial [Candidatus Woesearchaeota archaeon]|nr:DUF262 domain-containing protein [Candidatus Woesearchaeota archaeon]